MSLKEKLALQEKALIDLLSKAGKPMRSTTAKDGQKASAIPQTLLEKHTKPVRNPSSGRGAPLYQNGLSDRIDYEGLIHQSNMDHKKALEEKEKQLSALRARLIQQREDFEVILMREKSMKYYGSLLTSTVDVALVNGTETLSEENKRFISKLTSTLNYLLNDGDITSSMKNEVNDSELGSSFQMATASDEAEEKMKQALKKSVTNRRGSINVVPFESSLLYDFSSGNEPNETQERAATAVSKNRRGTLNAVPLSMESTPVPHSPSNHHSIDDSPSSEVTDNRPTSTLTLAPVICHCRQLIPFHHLSGDLEQQCSALFEAVYVRSRLSFNELTKSVELQTLQDPEPVNQWIGKSAFLNFLFSTGHIDAKLTMQACIYCFDKAANENSSRSQYKLNMRLYYEDFVSALTSASLFKYSASGNTKDNNGRLAKLEKIVQSCGQSMAMKDEMIYYELSNIFKFCKFPEFFTTLSNSQLVLLKAYKRCVNYASTHCGFEGNQKRQWSSQTASSGNKEMAAFTTVESSGRGFYYFCKSYGIFPTLTQEATCRRVAQHVRKVCEDSVTSFFAGLIYLALSLANNSRDSTPSVGSDESDVRVDADPHLIARMSSIIERVVVHIECETLKLGGGN